MPDHSPIRDTFLKASWVPSARPMDTPPARFEPNAGERRSPNTSRYRSSRRVSDIGTSSATDRPRGPTQKVAEPWDLGMRRCEPRHSHILISPSLSRRHHRKTHRHRSAGQHKARWQTVASAKARTPSAINGRSTKSRRSANQAHERASRRVRWIGTYALALVRAGQWLSSVLMTVLTWLLTSGPTPPR